LADLAMARQTRVNLTPFSPHRFAVSPDQAAGH